MTVASLTVPVIQTVMNEETAVLRQYTRPVNVTVTGLGTPVNCPVYLVHPSQTLPVSVTPVTQELGVTLCVEGMAAVITTPALAM